MQNPTKKDAILPVSVMLCMHSLIALCVFVVPVMAPKIGMDAQLISLFVPVLYLSSTIFTPFSGPFTGRFGPMRMMQSCVLVSSIGVGLCCLGGMAFMFAGAACIGLSLGLATPAASDILLRYTPTSIRSLIFSIKQAAVPLGNLIAGLLVLLAVIIGWQYALLMIAIVGIAMAFVFQPFQKNWDEGRDTASHVAFTWQSFINAVRTLVANLPLRWLAISSFAFVLLQIASASYLVTYMVQHIGLTHETAGMIYAVAFTGSFFARILFGVVADNFLSPMKTLGLLGIVMGAASYGIAQYDATWPLWLTAFMIFLLAATAAGWNGVYIAEVASRAPKGQAANVMGISLVVTYCGCILTPIVFGTILTFTTNDFPFAYSIFAIPAIVVGIRLFLLKVDQE
ncbi:MFS transporter [Alphaproteobacteria bacterium]|jgi:MFS family permease|nr:MFS transporter [Alphaproteobacteria bacterium]